MLWMEKDWNIKNLNVTFDQVTKNNDFCFSDWQKSWVLLHWSMKIMIFFSSVIGKNYNLFNLLIDENYDFFLHWSTKLWFLFLHWSIKIMIFSLLIIKNIDFVWRFNSNCFFFNDWLIKITIFFITNWQKSQFFLMINKNHDW